MYTLPSVNTDDNDNSPTYYLPGASFTSAVSRSAYADDSSQSILGAPSWAASYSDNHDRIGNRSLYPYGTRSIVDDSPWLRFQDPYSDPIRFRYPIGTQDALRPRPRLFPSFPQERTLLVGGPRKRLPPLSKPGPTRKMPNLYCELCKVSCVGPKALEAHERGQRHQKRLEQKNEERKPPTKRELKARARELHCPLCDVSATGAEAFGAHLAGKAHQRTVRLHRELGKPVPALPNLPESALQIASTDKPSQVEKRSSLSSALPLKQDSVSKAPVVKPNTAPTAVTLKQALTQQANDANIPVGAVGAEYVEKIDGPGKKAVHYRCKLCDCQFTNKDARDLHLTGRRHKLQYRQKVDPAYVIDQKTTPSYGRGAPFGRLTDIPPMPNPSRLPWATFLTPSSGSRFVYRSQASFNADNPNLALVNRYLTAKHAQVVPTELEARAMKTVVSLCEHSLKEISDGLLSGKYDSADDELDSSHEETADDSVTNEENRLLRGVVRVGPLGKSLLLRGDHEARLVLVCSEWPTGELLCFLKGELRKGLPGFDPGLQYEVITNHSIGTVTVITTKPEKSVMGSEPWPTITVHIQVTSPVVLEDSSTDSGASGAVTADGLSQSVNTALVTAPEQPSAATKGSRDRGRHLFAHGHERIPKNHCLDALDAIDQAKWFQAALAKPPLGLVSRVLLDFMRANEVWLELDEFALLAFLDRLLLFELQKAYIQPMRPFSGYSTAPVRPPAPFRPTFPLSARNAGSFPSSIPPAVLFRRFFEAMASGLLLQLKVDPTDSQDGNSKFFAFSALADSPAEIREAVTISAQSCLRQIAFNQLDKVLRIDPPTNEHRMDIPNEDIETEEPGASESSMINGDNPSTQPSFDSMELSTTVDKVSKITEPIPNGTTKNTPTSNPSVISGSQLGR